MALASSRYGGVWLLVVLQVLLQLVEGHGTTYDALCDDIVSLAKLAAQAHNTGDEESALSFRQRVHETYREAVALDDDDPQAPLNYATFLLNTNEFDEAAELFDAVLSKVGHDPRARSQILMSSRRAQYGKWSQRRDAAYNEGRGDIFETAELAEKQLEVSAEPHRTKHELATFETMLCEYDVKACENAGLHFRVAAMSSMQHYINFQTPRMGRGDRSATQRCLASQLHVGSWGGHRLVHTDRVYDSMTARAKGGPADVGSVYVHTFEVEAQLIGRDGCVVLPSEVGDCSVFSPASDYLLNLADNVLPQSRSAAPRPDAPTHTVPVLSLMQFSAASFYHWLGEAVPRLSVALDHLSTLSTTSLKVRVIVPRLSSRTSFVTASIDLLFRNNGFEAELVEYVPGTKVQTQLRFVSWDPQPCPPLVADRPTAFNPSRPGRQCLSLAHPYALNRARARLLAAVDRGSWGSVRQADGVPLILFVGRGPDATMRRVDEEGLARRLRQMLLSESTVLGPTEFEVVDTSVSLELTLSLFRRAAVIVGVHGGAMTNMVVCSPGTTVIEIGFAADGAQHYQHMALSLGLNYRRVRVLADALGRAMGAPEVRFQSDAVLDATRAALGCWTPEAIRSDAAIGPIATPSVDSKAWDREPTQWVQEEHRQRDEL